MCSRRYGRSCSQWLPFMVGVVMMGSLASCSDEFALLFNFSSLGGDIPGRRADLKVKFVNQTPYRPVFTYGTYDPLNTPSGDASSFPPKFGQFVIDTSTGGTRLDAFSESAVITWTRESLSDPGGCGRAISLGNEALIKLIEDDTTLLDEAKPEALRPLCNDVTNKPTYGIAFFRETSPGPAEDACITQTDIVAWSDPAVTLQGEPSISPSGDVQYPCDGSTVVFTFVEDNIRPGGIRIDVGLLPPPDETTE